MCDLCLIWWWGSHIAFGANLMLIVYGWMGGGVCDRQAFYIVSTGTGTESAAKGRTIKNISVKRENRWREIRILVTFWLTQSERRRVFLQEQYSNRQLVLGRGGGRWGGGGLQHRNAHMCENGPILNDTFSCKTYPY